MNPPLSTTVPPTARHSAAAMRATEGSTRERAIRCSCEGCSRRSSSGSGGIHVTWYDQGPNSRQSSRDRATGTSVDRPVRTVIAPSYSKCAVTENVGGPGFELYVPVEMTRHVYLALTEAGQGLGLRDAGYYALDALRIEQGRRAWGAELGPDETPWEAGLGFSVKLDKPSAFIGQAALRAGQGQPLRKKLVTLVVQSPAYVWGGETILLNESPVGEISSAGYSPLAQACVALGYVRGEGANRPHDGTPAQIDLWGERMPVLLYDRWPPASR